MRVTFIENEVPNTEHSTVSYSALLFLQVLREAGHPVCAVLPLPQHSMISDAATRQRWLRELAQLGVEVQIVPGDPPPKTYSYRGEWRVDRVRPMIWPKVEDYFPHVRLAAVMAEQLARARPDVIFIWGGYEGVAATHGLRIAPRLAFMGDPVHLPELYRRRPPLAQPRSPFAPSWLRYKLSEMQRVRMMIRLLSDCESIAATAAHHAGWFRSRGLSRCKYLPNMIPDWGGADWARRRARAPANAKFRIVLMGHVRGTATLAGLHTLAVETLPALEHALGDAFEVHICGKDGLPPELEARLDRPAVRLRGFVPDMVEELLSSDVFLVPTPIELGIRVRIPYAWSCGCCVVAHRANARGLPEMRHEENALLGPDGVALAREIVRIRDDSSLRERVRIGGRETYETSFSRAVTGGKIIAELEATTRRADRDP